VEEIQIHPEGDLSQMVCIGKEITDELEMVPARLYIKRYIRYKLTVLFQNMDSFCFVATWRTLLRQVRQVR